MKRIVATLAAAVVAVVVMAPVARADYGFTGETLNQSFCMKDNPITPSTFLRLIAGRNGSPAVTVAEFGPEVVKQDVSGECPSGFAYYADLSWVATEPGTYVVTACIANRLSESRTVCAAPFPPTIVTDKPATTTATAKATVKCKKKSTGKVKVVVGTRCPSGYVKVKR